MKKYIVSKPDIMGGAPCIVGTRVPVEVILYRLEEGVSLKELDKMYPWVGLGKFEGMLEELARKVSKLKDDQTVLQTQAAFDENTPTRSDFPNLKGNLMLNT